MSVIPSRVRRFHGTGDMVRKNRSTTTVGGFENVDTSNRFVYYEQMSLMSPHIFVPLHKTALTICKKYRFESKNDNEELVKDFERWAKRINLDSKLRTLIRLTCRNGTFVALWDEKQNNPDWMTFEPLIMSKLTILPEGFNPDDPDVSQDFVLTTPIERFIVNEGDADDEKVFEYEPEEVVYIAMFPFDYMQKDIKDRNTYGVYGISLLESVMDIFNKYMDIIEGFATFVKKYGQGRYHIDYTALEEMLAQGNVKEVLAILDKMREMHETIMANEDIISTGCKISTIDTGNGSLTVTDFKKSLENDIEVGLMQSPITMGKGEGSTYASGYIAESERLLTLEGLQQEFTNLINDQIIKPRALLMGIDPLNYTEEIELVFDDISEPNIPLADLIEAYVQDVIDFNEVREMIDMMPRQDQPDNGVNPTKLQAEQAKAALEQQATTAKLQAEATRQQGNQPIAGKSNVQKNTELAQKSQEKRNRATKLS